MLRIPNSRPESRSWNLKMLSLEIESRKWNRDRYYQRYQLLIYLSQCHQTSLKDKKMDAFLDEVYKKKVSNEIKQRKRENKLSQSHVLFQDLSSITSELF